MHLWHIVVALLVILSVSTLTWDARDTLKYLESTQLMADNVPFTPNRASRTPSPGPMLQPSSGPNPIFEASPPKRRGGQPMSIKVKRQRIAREEAERERETWTEEQSTADFRMLLEDVNEKIQKRRWAKEQKIL
ncbi:hypothetical protein B0H14DRAFT_3505475 [Mycena olivaceomarginata]|nr:hypothetical protein B0H14DRAFT_3505475 [Mycena olivaceomarginata]